MQKVKKRNSKVVAFDPEKIKISLTKAFTQVGEGTTEDVDRCFNSVLAQLKEAKNEIILVEDIQDIIENTLMKEGYFKTARAFILYRQEHKTMRELKEVQDDWGISLNAIQVLKERYLLDNETPLEMIKRTAKFFGKDKEEKDRFFELFKNKRGLPNSPAFANAGTNNKIYSACSVLSIDDSLEGIFETLKRTAILHKLGVGTGFSFSNLREKNAPITGSKSGSSGVLSWIRIYNAATSEIKQGGRRRGANMGVLFYTHPEILDFITMKDKENISSFNLSVMVDNNLMYSLEDNDPINLISPHTGKITEKVPAQQIFNLMAFEAWKKGDPGILFYDRINEDNFYSPKGEDIVATNPCSESCLLNEESCDLGSLNVSLYENDSQLAYDAQTMCLLLNRIIDKNKFPFKEMNEAMLATRKIGIGICGFGDLLLKRNIVYGSQESLDLLKHILEVIKKSAHETSCSLNYPKVYNGQANTTLLSIAPTGTLATLMGCSFSIEPPFGWIYERRILDGSIQVEKNPIFAERFPDLDSATINKIKSEGTIANIEVFSKKEKEVFRSGFEIPPEQHLVIQATAQQIVDLGVSKTINLPSSATIDDVKKIYFEAWKLRCKGVTVYRNGSLDNQPIKYKDITECGTDRCSSM